MPVPRPHLPRPAADSAAAARRDFKQLARFALVFREGRTYHTTRLSETLSVFLSVARRLFWTDL